MKDTLYQIKQNTVYSLLFAAWIFLLFTITLMRMGWFIIDEEFFIVGAFLGFLVLAHGSVAKNLSEGLDLKIASIYSSTLLSRDLALQVLAQLYDFYQAKLQLVRTQKTLRAVVASELSMITTSQYLDARLWAIQSGLQTFSVEAAVVIAEQRLEDLWDFFDIYGEIKDEQILSPIVDGLGLESVAKALDRRTVARNDVDSPASQTIAAMVFAVVDGDCISST